MTYNILFAVCGIGLITFGVSLVKLNGRVDRRQFKDSRRLDEAFKRIQDLEDRLEAQASELTEHHNKIDTLEINGGIYEGLFEQQGLWEETENAEVPEFPDPEDEENVI